MTFGDPDDYRSDKRYRGGAVLTQQGSADAIYDSQIYDSHGRNDEPSRVRAEGTRLVKDRSDHAFSPHVPRELAADEILRTQFERIVVPHLDEAYVLARRLTGNGTDAQDIVQEASLSAYRAITSYANGDARTWILTIVRHCAYQWLRKNRRSALVHLEDLEEIEEALTKSEEWLAETPEAALIAKTDAKRLEAAIGTIPAPFRETLILREIRGLDYREIAEITKVPIGTVMSRLARARRRLIAELGTGES